VFRRMSRIAAAISVVFMTVLAAAPALAAACSIRVVDADLQPGRKSVQLTVNVRCVAPAEATSYLSTVLFQGQSSPDPSRYHQGQGQIQVLCNGTAHGYSFTAILDPAYADSHFSHGRAMTESTVQYCIEVSPGNTVCTVLIEPLQQKVRIHR
jgi:spore coat protein U-like protein